MIKVFKEFKYGEVKRGWLFYVFISLVGVFSSSMLFLFWPSNLTVLDRLSAAELLVWVVKNHMFYSAEKQEEFIDKLTESDNMYNLAKNVDAYFVHPEEVAWIAKLTGKKSNETIFEYRLRRWTSKDALRELAQARKKLEKKSLSRLEYNKERRNKQRKKKAARLFKYGFTEQEILQYYEGVPVVLDGLRVKENLVWSLRKCSYRSPRAELEFIADS